MGHSLLSTRLNHKGMSRHSIPLQMICLFAYFMLLGFPIWGQANARVVRTINLPDTIHPVGNFQLMDDSIVLVPSNGGVYDLSRHKWHIYPDSQRILLSYCQETAIGPAFLTAFNNLTQHCTLYKRTLFQGNAQLTKIADLPEQGIFQVNSLYDALLIYGTDKNGFRFFECRRDSLSTILHTDKHPPDYISLFNQNTLLFSIGTTLFSCTRYGGIRKLMEFEEPILSFAVPNDTCIILSTRRGLFVQSPSGRVMALLAGNYGEVIYRNNLLYCMLWEDRLMKIVRYAN